MNTIPDKYYTIEEAAEVICELGIRATKRQVRRWADKGTLPFFPWENCRYIEDSALRQAFRKLQAAKIRPGKSDKEQK